MMVAGDNLRKHLLLEIHDKFLYVLKLTIGYETVLTSNIARKDRKCQDFTKTLQYHYNNIKFLSLSISTLGVLSSHSIDFITMLKITFYRRPMSDLRSKKDIHFHFI